MQTFQSGRTYQTRSIGDHDCIIRVTVSARTAKTIKTSDGKSFRVAVYDDCEFIRPWGKYSMSPILRADKFA